MHTNNDSAHGGYERQEKTKPPNWHALVAWDVLCNNLATGLFLTATCCELAAPEMFTPVARVAYPIALVLLLIDLALLTIDLGDPLRFHHMLRLIKLRSPMSVGVWSLSAFALPATVAAALSFVPGESETMAWARRIAAIVGLVPALASAVYKGVLFSTTAQPVWKDARWLGAYLTASAVMLGCAEMLGLALLLGQQPAINLLRLVLALLLLLSLVPLGLLLADVRAAVRRLGSHGHLGRASVLAIAGGIVVPLLLLVFGSTSLLLGAVLLILIGSLVSRYVIVYAPHSA